MKCFSAVTVMPHTHFGGLVHVAYIVSPHTVRILCWGISSSAAWRETDKPPDCLKCLALS